MKLFNETMNKYYELISYLLNSKKSFSDKDLNKFMAEFVFGEIDFEVVDTLFSREIGQEVVFSYEDEVFMPIIENKFPIRNNAIELQAVKSLIGNRYAKHFLSDSTERKIMNVTSNIVPEWDVRDIEIKNQYLFGVVEDDVDYEKELSIIASAIRGHNSISYDNVRPGVFEYREAKVLPIKIEYSFVNDLYRICAFEPTELRFIKMNLRTMSNIKKNSDYCDNLEEDYKKFLKKNTIKIILDIEPINHVVERCFRIFSFYNRRAIYDKDENKYRLEISYFSFDENEVIRNILSLGSSVIVIEPARIQKEVYRRILSASQLYFVDKN